MQERKNNPKFATRTLAYCAMLAALSVILARLIIPMPNEFTRFSIEAVPIFLSGMLFGPLAGGLVGFAADFVGTLFSPFGFNPLFCVPPILYGVCAGIFRNFLAQKVSIPRLTVSFLPPVVFGSILYQSATLAFVYASTTFKEAFVLRLGERSIQFAVTIVLDVLVIYLLFKVKIFDRLGIWPPKTKKKPNKIEPNL